MAVEIDDMIYINTPKTGSTYIRELLLKQCQGKLIGENHDPSFVIMEKTKTQKKFFTFIRHPLSIICSAWGHWHRDNLCRERNTNNQTLDIWSYKNLSKYFLECINEENLDVTVNNFILKHPNFMMFFLDTYTQNINIIGRQENLNNDLAKILSSYDIKHEEPVNTREFKPKLSEKTVNNFMKSHKNVLTKYEYNYIPTDIEIIA